MENDSFDDDFGDFLNSPPKKTQKRNSQLRRKDNGDADSQELDEEQFRRDLMSYSQRQTAGGVGARRQHGETVDARNEFEKLLISDFGLCIRNDENGDMVVDLGAHLNHAAFVDALNATLSDVKKKDAIVDALVQACKQRSQLRLYLSPTTSQLDEQDTILRALLLCRHTQTTTFDVLMYQADALGKGDGSDAEGDQLALACVEQTRFIDRIFDSKTLFRLIFDREVEEWRSSPRDTLITALPEILPDPVSQQEAILLLSEMLPRQPPHDPLSMKLALIRTMAKLQCDQATASKLRGELTRGVMQLEPLAVVELVAFCLHSLPRGDVAGFRAFLGQLGSHLHFDKLRQPRGSQSRMRVEDVVLEVCDRLTRYVRLEGQKAWKEVMAYLRTSAGLGKTAETDKPALDQTPENGEDEAEKEEEEKQVKPLSLFDLLLSMALLSVEGCPPALLTLLRTQLSSQEEDSRALSQLRATTALAYSKFCSAHASSILRLSRHLVWSPSQPVRCFGAFLYSQMFTQHEKHRECVLLSLEQHLQSGEDTEAATALEAAETLARQQPALLAAHGQRLHRWLDGLDGMAVANARRMFGVLVQVSCLDAAADLRKYLDSAADSYLQSMNEKRQVWGLMARLMQLRAHLLGKHSDRDDRIRTCLVDMWTCVDKSAWLRSVFYQHMREVLVECERVASCDTLMAWADDLLETFKKEFFRERDEEPDLELEGARYCSPSSPWLVPDRSRLLEVGPLFQLLQQCSLLKERWAGEDADSQAARANHHKRFLFAAEANVSLCGTSMLRGVDDASLNENADMYWHVIQWCRLVLNTFSPLPATPELDEILIKRFALQMECEKALNSTLHQLKEWELPSLGEHSTPIVITAVTKTVKRQMKVKKPRAKKRKQGEEPAEGEGDAEEAAPSADETVADEAAVMGGDKKKVVARARRLPVAKLPSFTRPFTLNAVVRLLLLIQATRKKTSYLMERLLEILQVELPKKEVKAAPWQATAPPSIHGDSQTVWQLVRKALPVAFSILCNAVAFFRADLDNSDVHNHRPDVNIQMAELERLTLAVHTVIFSFKDVSSQSADSDKSRQKKSDRRRSVMEKLEHSILEQSNSQTESSEEADLTVLSFLVRAAEVVPSLPAAVALFDTVAALGVEGKAADEQRKILSGHALSCLRREWRDEEGRPLKGATYCTHVKKILDHFLRLLEGDQRLHFILWLLAEKVPDILPDADRRKSREFVQADRDMARRAGVEGELERAHMACLSRASFPGIYKVLFSRLSQQLGKDGLSEERVKAGLVSVAHCLSMWTIAAKSFCVLSKLLEVREIRGNAVMNAAASEGTRFLNAFANKSSFLYIVSDESRFSQNAAAANNVIKAVQMGNRTLQNIAVYAKQQKSASLLRTLPELRAASEFWMRSVQTAIVFVDCQDAFEIGLRQSRDMDGEKIVDDADEEEMEESNRDDGEGVDDMDLDDATRAEETAADEDDDRGSEI